jgi:hypothetical protein
MAAVSAATAFVLAACGCSTAPPAAGGGRGPETAGAPETEGPSEATCACEGTGAGGTASAFEGAAAPEAGDVTECASAAAVGPAPPGDDAPEETRREVRQLWEKFRGLLLKNERDPAAFKGLVDEPEGFEQLESCLTQEMDLAVEWLRMSGEDLRKAEAHFRFFLDRKECKVYFTGLGDESPPELLLCLVDGRWVVWPQRG